MSREQHPCWFEKIKVVCVDVDGVLTDGMYNHGYIREINPQLPQLSDNLQSIVDRVGTRESFLFKSFYSRDIWAIEEVIKRKDLDIHIYIITQSSDSCVDDKFSSMQKKEYGHRLKILKGVENKKEKIDAVLADKAFATWEPVLYIGDAENDIECLQNAKWPCCPKDAVPSVVQLVEDRDGFVSTKCGGKGCVHEVLMYFLEMHEKWKSR